MAKPPPGFPVDVGEYKDGRHFCHMEPIMTYSEQRFAGKRMFQLFASSVVIRRSEVLGSSYEQTIYLESLQPEFDRTWHRSKYCMEGLKLATGSCVALSVLHSGFGIPMMTHLGVLSVARAGKQVSEYDAFVQRLIQQIQACARRSD